MMIDVDALKEVAAAAEIEVATLRTQLADLQTKKDQLCADRQREADALAEAEQTAAARRAEAAMARAEGRQNSTVRIPDLAALREAARTTKDAITYVADKIAELQPAIDAAEARKQSALGRLDRHEVGTFLIDVAPIFAEISRRLGDRLGTVEAQSIRRALGAALGLDSAICQRNVVHEGMLRIFGHDSAQCANCGPVADQLSLSAQMASALPVIGAPSAAVLQALSDERLAASPSPKFVELKPKPQRTVASTWPISARGA